MSGVLPCPLADEVKQSVNALKNKRENPELVRFFEIISLAWTTHRQVAMQYQSLQSHEIKDWLLDAGEIQTRRPQHPRAAAEKQRGDGGLAKNGP